MKKLIVKIDSWLKGKEPHRIFYDSHYHYKSYKNPKIGAGVFGMTDYGYDWTTYDYTRLGAFMNKLPELLDMLIKAVYYVITWPVYLIVMAPWWLFCALCIPSGWL